MRTAIVLTITLFAHAGVPAAAAAPEKPQGRNQNSAEQAIDPGRPAPQRGHVGALETIRAWPAQAGHWVLGFKPSPDPLFPRLIAEYNYASGDSGVPGSPRRTFDQLYPTNPSKYGAAGRIGWRNIHDAMAGGEWKPTKKWKLNLDFHTYWLASRADALYSESGVALVRNPGASNSRVGEEIDFQALYRYNERLQLGFGYAHLFPGPYLRQSTGGSPVSAPYLMWTYSL
ncbi:MAG: hypothetical protein FJW37_09995 [Acidobacteria bacterium]|nr:hypothetical protein [Acidobacteriota bacterium]